MTDETNMELPEWIQVNGAWYVRKAPPAPKRKQTRGEEVAAKLVRFDGDTTHDGVARYHFEHEGVPLGAVLFSHRDDRTESPLVRLAEVRAVIAAAIDTERKTVQKVIALRLSHGGHPTASLFVSETEL